MQRCSRTEIRYNQRSYVKTYILTIIRCMLFVANNLFNEFCPFSVCEFVKNKFLFLQINGNYSMNESYTKTSISVKGSPVFCQ